MQTAAIRQSSVAGWSVLGCESGGTAPPRDGVIQIGQPQDVEGREVLVDAMDVVLGQARQQFRHDDVGQGDAGVLVDQPQLSEVRESVKTREEADPDRRVEEPIMCISGPPGYLSNRDMRRSASSLPPVWQVAQYCSEESANDTSRTVSPQTGHG